MLVCTLVLGHAVLQLVETLHYRPEDCGLEYGRGHYCNCSHYGCGFDSAYKINECQKYFLLGCGG
jgi:hypothetical protein